VASTDQLGVARQRAVSHSEDSPGVDLALADAASSRWRSRSSFVRKSLRVLGRDGVHESGRGGVV